MASERNTIIPLKNVGNRIGGGCVSKLNKEICSFLFEIEFETQKVIEKLPFQGHKYFKLIQNSLQAILQRFTSFLP